MTSRSTEHTTEPTTEAVLVLAKQRRRIALGSAAALLVLHLGYIALTTSTTVLSGRIAGLGTAYWAGFAIFALVLAVAHAYARWARRMDDLGASVRDGGEPR